MSLCRPNTLTGAIQSIAKTAASAVARRSTALTRRQQPQQQQRPFTSTRPTHHTNQHNSASIFTPYTSFLPSYGPPRRTDVTSRALLRTFRVMAPTTTTATTIATTTTTTTTTTTATTSLFSGAAVGLAVHNHNGDDMVLTDNNSTTRNVTFPSYSEYLHHHLYTTNANINNFDPSTNNSSNNNPNTNTNTTISPNLPKPSSTDASALFSTLTAHAAYHDGKRRGSLRTTNLSESLYPHGGLTTQEFKQFPLIQKLPVDRGRYFLEFQLPDPVSLINFNHPLQYLLVRYKKNGEYFMNKYYPYLTRIRGTLRIVVDSDQRDDVMGEIWDEIVVGDSVELSGPFYHDFQYEPNRLGHVFAIIATPSAAPPVLQLLDHAFPPRLDEAPPSDDPDTTGFTVVYCIKNAEGAQFSELFNTYYNNFPERFRVYYVFDTAAVRPEDYRRGFFEKNIRYGGLRYFKQLRSLLGHRPIEGRPFKVLVGGPDGFVSDLCGPERAYDPDGDTASLQGWLYRLRYMDNDVYVL